jgi:threonine/homoserine/homoserine lactone efflux protein
MELLLKGIIIGLSVAIPVGPSGLLCIQRSLLQGVISGIFVGLGAATGDAFFSFLAALGLTFLYKFIQNQQVILNIIGGLILVYFGLKIFFSVAKVHLTQKKSSLINSFFLSLFFTLINPMTILFFISVFPAFNITISHAFSLLVLMCGTFLGSILWFTILSFIAHGLRLRLSNDYITLINKASGILILFIGLYLLLKNVTL